MTVGLPHTLLKHLSSVGLSITVCGRPAGGCILSVAVVKNSSLDIRSLRGLRSCHSGVRWTAGWSLPLGFLLSRNYLSWSKEQPLNHGNEIRIGCTVCKSFYFLFRHLWSSKFSVLSLVFLLSSRRQYLFQCQLHSWSCCPGATTLRSVPRPEVLHSPEELPLRNVPQ